jgi:flagellar assembly protein FliH
MMRRLPIDALSGVSTFRRDPRFAPAGPVPEQPAAPEPKQVDPIALAFTQGYEAGLAEARAETTDRLCADNSARDSLILALPRIDTARADDLATRLRDTVAVLCEASLAPLALDPAMLSARATRAAAMLADADAAIVIHLHPEDLPLVAPGLGGDWTLTPHPTLERGAIRVVGEAGGIEDGPAQWRRTIAEALGTC